MLDRDTLPDRAEPRRGVPQGAHVHVLLISGLNELNKLFPGFEEEVIEAGGLKFDTGSGLGVFRYGRMSRPIPNGLALVSASRPLIETVIRRRVAELPSVDIRDEVAVSGLANDANSAVTGVVLDTGETIPADLVVDCTGRGARSDQWLGALGFPAPERLEVRVGVGYATRIYRRRPGDLPDRQGILTLPDPPGKRTYGGVLPVEGDRWLVGLSGWHTSPPADVEQFERFAKELPDSTVSEVMNRAEPLSDVVVFRFPSSRRRLFEKLDRLPGGYVALGDALCSFNPIYGQGMTCAVQSASALGRVLDQQHDDAAVPKAFYAAASKIIGTPWNLTLGNDFAYPQTTGPRPPALRLRNWYALQVELAAQIDSEIGRVFTSVRQLVIPPEVLFRPAFAIRVLRMARKRRRAGHIGGSVA